MKPEAKVKSEARKIIKAYAAYYLPIVMHSQMPTGTPDANSCYRGRYIAIEYKATAKSMPTPIQKRRLFEIRQAGGIALVINKDNISRLEELYAYLQTTPYKEPAWLLEKFGDILFNEVINDGEHNDF